jgi:hypothetical protein
MSTHGHSLSGMTEDVLEKSLTALAFVQVSSVTRKKAAPQARTVRSCAMLRLRLTHTNETGKASSGDYNSP